MKRSDDRILTSHAGRLGHPEDLVKLMSRTSGARNGELRERLRSAVGEIVRAQAEIGIDVVSDGELGKLAWFSYTSQRLSGFSPRSGVIFATMGQSRDWQRFADFYSGFAETGMAKRTEAAVPEADVACTGPVSYIGHDALLEDIANLKAALEAVDVTEAFMPSTSPGSILAPNEHYPSEEEYLFALGDALHEEYKMITDAGLVLQLDEPVLPSIWDWMGFVESEDIGGYHDRCAVRIEAMNRALEGIPRERVRAHICWGSWHGPHTTDVSMKTIIPLLLQMNVGGWSVEAGNVRHEHEFEAWKGLDLDGRVLMPGVVSHATDTVEHPELVAWRLKLWSDCVGRENVIAGTDCGLGDRVHPLIERAKLEALVEGARLASNELY